MAKRNHPYLFVEQPDRYAVVDFSDDEDSAGVTVTMEHGHNGQLWLKVVANTQESEILLDQVFDLPNRQSDCIE